MATIKDIARCAGVSHATVSNVLNHKGNVSAQKIKLVTDAARKMGYRTNEAASALRSGGSMTIAVILPEADSIACGDLYKSVCQAAADRGYGVTLKTTGNVPGAECRAIEEVLSARARFCVAVSSLPAPRKQYEALTQSGARVIFALRGRQEGFPYAGFDMTRAGREIGEKLIEANQLNVGLMTNMALYTSEADFKAGLLCAVQGAGGRVRCVQSIASQYGKQAFALLEGETPEAIVTTEEEMAQAVLRACAFLGKRTAVYTLAAQRVIPPAFYQGYSLNYRALGEKLTRLLIDGAPEGDEPEGMQGFEQTPAPFALAEQGVLRMLSADTPATRALCRLLPRLKADTGLSLTITLLPTGEVSRAFQKPDVMRAYDIVRMDLSLMDSLAERLLTPLDRLDVDVPAIFRGFLPGMADEYSLVSGLPLAFPFDPGCHLLFFREDLLGDARVRRAYLEKYREPLEIPKTRDAYAKLAAFLEAFSAAEGSARRGAILTNRPSECVSDLASLGVYGHWPRLGEEAMEDYARRQREIEKSALLVDDGSWNSAVARFAQGESAMLIAHSNYACGLADNPLSRVSGRVGFAPAPGRKAFLGGGVVGAVNGSARQKSAALFFRWLYGDAISSAMALLCGCSPWARAYERAELRDIYPWLGAVRVGLTNGVRRGLFTLASPPFDQMRLEKEIARLCAQAVDGTLSAREAARAVNELTQR